MTVENIKRFITTVAPIALIAVLVFGALIFTADTTFAVDKSAACEGVQATGGSCAGGEVAIKNIINTVVDVLSIIVGAVSVIMIIIGGLRYITSAGESSNVQAAKNTILYAIVGLIVVIFAQAIVAFVVNRVA